MTQPPPMHGIESDAEAMLNSGRLADAKQLYSRMSQMDPTNVDVWYILGAINGELGQVEEAATCLHKALELQPDDADINFTLAKVLLHQRRHHEAMDLCIKATQVDPAYEEAWLLLSCLQGQLDRLAESEVSAHKVLAINPNNMQANVNLGRALYGQGKFAEAASILRQLAIKQPEVLEHHAMLAACYLTTGKPNKAEAVYREILRHQPGMPQAQDGLGSVYYNRGMVWDAIRCFQLALVADQNYIDAYIHLGNALQSIGCHDKALQRYQEAIRMNPDNACLHEAVGSLPGNERRL